MLKFIKLQMGTALRIISC